MAAGEGRRLRPLTERWAKPVLPIDGRPVIATLLRELASAGFERVTVVVGHLSEQIERLLGDGRAFGVDVRYGRQPEALGSADAVSRGLEAGATPPLLVTAADMVYTRGDMARARDGWLASGAPGGLGVREIPASRLRHEALVTVEGGRVLEIGGRPQTRNARTLTAAPVWFLDEVLAASLSSLAGPPFELAAAFQQAIDGGRTIAALELGPTRDLTHPEDVVSRNFPYLWRTV